jgi:2-haloacid dehalogenase
MAELDFDRFEVLTFDCYGTLIDWEEGLLGALRPVLERAGVEVGDDEMLELYATHEAELETGQYLRYRDVLAEGLVRLGEELAFEPTPEELDSFAVSVRDWPAFGDSGDALRRLQERFKLAVITNCDGDLFAASAERLGVEFDWVITAEECRSYKPSHNNFEVAFERIALPPERILHVAQSLFHDHVPANEIGLASVWINRRAGKPGAGATPPAEAAPDLTFPDMRSFAEAATT